MEFEDAEGVESSAGHVTRTMAGSGWNVGATSKRAITKIGDEVRGVSADCDQTDKSMMIGLNSGSTNSVDEVVDFGIVCDNGVIRISEHGVVRDGDFGDYFVGETFQVVVLDSGVVTYYKDGAAFATSDEAPAFPLYATARFNTAGASFSRVSWIQTVHEGANDLDLIEWVGLSRGHDDGRPAGLPPAYCKAGTAGHRGAYSARAITKVGDEVRGISGDCMRTDNRHLQFGLSSTPSGHSQTTIDYAVFCNGNQVRFQEKGVNKFDAGVFVAGETFQVIVNDAGAIEFYVDGDLKYTSLTSPSFPLYADTSFHNHLAELANARWVYRIIEGADDLEPVEFLLPENATLTPGSLAHVLSEEAAKRIEEASLLAFATSRSSIRGWNDTNKGVSADCSDNKSQMMFGLMVQGDQDAQLNETAANETATAPAQTNLSFAIYCDAGTLRLLEDGVVIKTIEPHRRSEPNTPHGIEGQLQVPTPENDAQGPPPSTHLGTSPDLALDSLDSDSPEYINDQHNASAFQRHERIVEPPSAYSPGETFSIVINEHGVIEYLQNGNVLHVSTKSVEFPLYSQARIFTEGAKLSHMHWVNMMDFETVQRCEVSHGDVYLPVTPEKMDIVRSTSKRAVTKIYDEVRGISADCSDTTTKMIFGLSSAHYTPSDGDAIEYAVGCNAGTMEVYEDGELMATIGTYLAGETFQVAFNDEGIVHYYKEGHSVYNSSREPIFPLFADGYVDEGGGHLENVKWIKVVHKGSRDLDLIEWVGLSQGMTTDGKQGYLKRTEGGNNWARGAYSARAITKVGDEVRGISGDCMRTDNRHLQFGLSSTPSGHSQTTIDYAVFCNGNQVRFQEKGVNKFDAGVFVAGETFQVIVNDAGAIEFYVDGDLKYTSLTSPSFPLYADTSFHNHLAELANARWVHKVVKGANDLAAMEFEDAEGVESSAGQVTRTMAGSGWNVGATSKRAITKIGDEVRGVSADCDQTDKSMMIGLNSGSTNSVDEVVDFGIVCDNGVIRISEHGVVRDGDFGDYFVGETFQVVVLDSGVVTYYKDGAAFATSDEAPAFPLYATARFNTAGASFSRVSWIQTVHEGANDLDLIEWVGLSQGMTTDGKQGYLKRTEGGNNWARGAYSARAITKVGDEVRGISGDCMRTDNRHLQFGLSSTPSGHSQTTIDYAVFCNGNQVRFQEKGVNKFDAGVFVAGETFQVIVNDAGAIEFYVDGDLKYTSLTSPSFPLYADTSFHNHLAELANARWVHKVVKGANDLAAMEFEDAEGVESSAGQVTRTMAGSGWNVGATSKRAITKIGDEVRGVSADCDQTDKSMMIGLNSGSTNSVDEVVDFGIVCDNGVIRISEHGVVRDGDFGDYFVGETFQVVVLDSGVVTYYKDGAAFATSDEAPAFPLYATARFNTAGASFSRVSWIQTVHEGANDLDLIEWVGLSQGMTTDGKQGYLKRTEGGNNWARGAYSARAITKVGDEIRGISGDCMRTDNRHLQFGLSSTPSGHSQTTIDYAVFCNGNQVRFQEKGVNKFDAGVFVAGETFQVIVNDAGAIEFYVDGDLKYTSLTSPSFPLYADTSFHNHLAELANARWVHKVVKGANDLAAMEFEDAEGVESSAGHVTRTMAGSGWNVGATSKRAITKIGDEVRGVSADCDQTDKSMMIGLNSGSTNSVDEVVDFGIVCDNGVIRISEHGVVRDGDFGDYFVGETFQVVVLDSGVVTYYKDGAAFATSDEAPAFPLYATARFNTAGASFSRVSWIQTVHEGANDLDLIEWVGLSRGHDDGRPAGLPPAY